LPLCCEGKAEDKSKGTAAIPQIFPKKGDRITKEAYITQVALFQQELKKKNEATKKGKK